MQFMIKFSTLNQNVFSIAEQACFACTPFYLGLVHTVRTQDREEGAHQQAYVSIQGGRVKNVRTMLYYYYHGVWCRSYAQCGYKVINSSPQLWSFIMDISAVLRRGGQGGHWPGGP